MKREFKVGDRVEFTEDHYSVRKGDRGTVTDVVGYAPFIYQISFYAGHTTTWSLPDRFKLIEEPKGIQRKIAVYDPEAPVQAKPVLLNLITPKGTQRPTLIVVDELGNQLGSILSFNNDGSILLMGGLKVEGIPVDGAGRAVIANLPSF